MCVYNTYAQMHIYVHIDLYTCICAHVCMQILPVRMCIIQAIWIRVLDIYARKLRDQASALSSPHGFVLLFPSLVVSHSLTQVSLCYNLPRFYYLQTCTFRAHLVILQQNTHLPSLTALPSQALSFAVPREE